MKKSQCLGLGAALAVLALANACAGGPSVAEIPVESRLIVAVAGIENAPDGTSSWDDQLVAGLLKTKRFRVIERARLDALLSENELSLSAIGDPDARPKMLKALGADAILFVKISDIRQYSGRWEDPVTNWWGDVTIGIEAKAAARLVSVSTGEILAAAEVSRKAEAGTFYGAMGNQTVDKGRDELVGEAISADIPLIAQSLAKNAPQKQ